LDLSEKYCYRKQSKEKPISNDVERMAYIAVRMPATFAAARAAFGEIPRLMPEVNLNSLLDLGSGPGTVAWAAIDIFDEIKQITLVEQDQDLIRLGKVLADYSRTQSLPAAKWHTMNLKTIGDIPLHDLVVCSYSLGEIEREAAVKILRTAWRSTRQAFVII